MPAKNDLVCANEWSHGATAAPPHRTPNMAHTAL